MKRWLSVCALLSGFVGVPVAAQEENPFGADPPATTGAETPAGEPATGLGAEVPAQPTDPLAELVMGGDPKSLADSARAIERAVRLGRADLAGPILERLSARAWDAGSSAEFLSQIDRGILLRATTSPKLNEIQRQAAAKLLEATGTALKENTSADSLIADLASNDRNRVLAARRGLAQAGSAGLSALVNELTATEPRVPRRDLLREIQRFGEDAVATLRTAAEGSSSPVGRVSAVEALGQLNPQAARMELLGAAFDPASSDELRQAGEQALAKWLGKVPSSQEASALFADEIRLAVARVRQAERPQELTTAWTIDPSSGRLESRSVTTRMASAREAARAASYLRAIGGTPKQLEDALAADLLYRSLLNESDETELSRPDWKSLQESWQRTGGLSSGQVSNVLQRGLDEHDVTLATAAAELLGVLGDPQAVRGNGAASTALVRSAAVGPPSARFMAAESVAQLATGEAYPGSSGVIETWLEMAQLEDRPLAILMNTDRRRGERLGLTVSDFGFRTAIVTTCRQLLSTVQQDVDLGLIVIPQEPMGCGLSELVDRIRSHPHGQLVPLVVVGNDPIRVEEVLAPWAGPSRVVESLESPEALVQLWEELRTGAGHTPLSTVTRQRFRQAGQKALARVAADPKLTALYQLPQYETRLARALTKAGFTNDAFQVWSALGTAASQRMLTDLAANSRVEPTARKQAAQAFAQSVARFGTRLDRGDVVRQYERFNATEDTDTKAALTIVLDALETRAVGRPAR